MPILVMFLLKYKVGQLEIGYKNKQLHTYLGLHNKWKSLQVNLRKKQLREVAKSEFTTPYWTEQSVYRQHSIELLWGCF